MPDNKFYQAPLERPGYVNPNISPIPAQPVSDVYTLFGVNPSQVKPVTRKKSAYEQMMEGGDPFAGLMPDVAPIDTNLATLEPLDDPAGIFHSQDGFGKYGYSTILAGGDNEARYAENFKRDNPNLFWRPGFHPWEGIQKGIYWGGGFLEKTLESAVIKTGQGFAGLYGMTIGNTIGLFTGENYGSFDGWLAKSSDNIFSSMFDSWDENLKERFHYFQEKSDRDKKGFISSLSDGDFWMNDISDGLGFLMSAAFEVGLISKLGLGTKAASRFAPLARGVSTEALAGRAVAKTGLQRTMNFIGIEGSGHSFVKNAVDLTAQTLTTTAIESAVEANEVKHTVYDSFEGKVNPETGMYYSEEEKQRLAAGAAAEVFKQNMTILIGPKFLETLVFNKIGKFAKGILNRGVGKSQVEAGRASSALQRAGVLRDGTSYEKLSKLKSLWKVGSLAGVGFLSEGLFEENKQLAITRQATQGFGGGDEFYRPGTSEENVDRLQSDDELFGNVGRRYIRQLNTFFKGTVDDRFIDDELSKSVGIGGLFGVVGGGVTGITSLKQQAKIDKYWNDRINRATTNLFQSNNFFKTEVVNKPDPADPNKTIPQTIIVTDPKTGSPVLDQDKMKAFLNKMNNIQGLMDIIANTEDVTDENNKAYQNKELNKLARNVLFSQLAMEYVRAGKKDLLLNNLASVSNFSDKDLQALGYEPGMMEASEVKEVLSKMTKMVERLDVADSWIEDNVIDNVSEQREAFAGLKYSKAQKEKRRLEFEAKKEYLRGLAMQNALLDSYLDDINAQEQTLDARNPPMLSSVLDADGLPVRDFDTPLHLNARIPALRNQLDVLNAEFAYHWDNLETLERDSPKGAGFNERSKANNGKNIAYSQLKVDEILSKINTLAEELEQLEAERRALLNDEVWESFIEDNETFIRPRDNRNITLEQLNADKIRRINAVKREEIGIQKGWVEEEWKLTAALKEEKTKAERPSTRLSRRMSGSLNAYNTYFQREVMDRDNSLGQRKMKLFDKDPNKIITDKKYKANEAKLLKAVRIQGKVQTIIAEVNGKKLLAELDALLNKNLPSGEFTTELKAIIDNYNGKPIVLSETEKSFIDDNIDEVNDEYNFVSSIFEYMPEDERFNDTYYDVDHNGNFVVKEEYDSLPALAEVQKNLSDRLADLKKIQSFLNSLPSEIPGDWNNVNTVKKRIADVYTETADSIINTYNLLSNNGTSEMGGDSLSTKQDLDTIDTEIDELTQLKVIFEGRDKTDKILSAAEFNNFIPELDRRIEELKKIRDIVKERLSSRLKENQNFLIDTVGDLVEQMGLNFDGTIRNEPIRNAIISVATPEAFSKLESSLTDLNALMNKADKTSEDNKAIDDAYWSINGQVAALQEVIKKGDKAKILSELASQKQAAIAAATGTALMNNVKGESYYKDIVDNLKDSILGSLQILFYQNLFSQVGVAGQTGNFLDDQPSSPVYKFREDFNLRKFIRAVELDNSRTPDNTEVSKEDLIQFLIEAKKIQELEELEKSLNSSINMLDQIEKEKEVVQAKIDKKDNKYESLILSSIQQIFFIRNIAAFLRRDTIKDSTKIGFNNWSYIQAPGGAGKTQTLGTWFNIVSGIPRDRVLATAFTEEAARGIKKALIVGEEGPKNAEEMAAHLHDLVKKNNFDQEVLIIDEFPAISVNEQKKLLLAIQAYTKAKLDAKKGEFKVIAMGDTNQLTFSENGTVIPRPSIIINPDYFSENKTGVNTNHPAKMNIIPSLTVNFRSNLFPVTSFIDQFKGSNLDNVNEALKVTSTDVELQSKDVKGVVGVSKADFETKMLNYLRLNADSTRTRTLIVNESKMAQYKALLESNGIKVITDPNDELTKGVYLTTVANVQGFSFDEVFIDFENNDKSLFAGTASLNYIFNKAMYVAASRARNLIVVTNFPNIENLEDTSIAALENKALEELQTKDADFLAQRDLEINGAKSILGGAYSRSVTTAAPVKEKEKVETPLDQESQTEEEGEGVTEGITEEQTEPENPADSVEEQEVKEDEKESVEDEQDTDTLNENVLPSDGLDENIEPTAETSSEAKKSIIDKIKDKAVTSYDKVRASVIELLFPTSATVKYKVTDGTFTTIIPENFENRNVLPGDRVEIIPFQQNKRGSKSAYNFGYAAVVPAVDASGSIIPNSYRTLGILSDKEIDNLKTKPETKAVYDAIMANEPRDKNFVSILYSDVSDNNGFTTDNSKVVNSLVEGVVASASPLKYFYNKEYRTMNKSEFDTIIENFINSFYKNHLNNFTGPDRAAELHKLRAFYAKAENAQIIIPTRKDVEGKNPNLNIPPDLRTIIRAGRPYIMFKPFHRSGTMQFISLSRKYLSVKDHNEFIAPIREFLLLGKVVRSMLEKKGVTQKLGYSRSLSNMLSKLATEYATNPGNSTYNVKLISTVNGAVTSQDLTFSNVEAERIFNLYSMYSVPNTQKQEAKTEQEIKNLVKVKRARNYTFEDGETIYGVIESYDPATKSFVVIDKRSGESHTKTGTVSHTSKSYTGQAQKALDDLFNANGNISALFTSTVGKTGFVTDKDTSGNAAKREFSGYKFMNLLGSKTAPVAKSYNNDGTPNEIYEDVLDILESLFNFTVKDELPGRKLNYINNEGVQQNTEVKFRVPVPLFATNEAGELEYNYSYSDRNTSRDSAISNSKFFETNFESVLPTSVHIEFGTEQTETKTQEQTPEKEQTVTSFAERIVKGEKMTSPEDLQFYENNRTEIEEKLREMAQSNTSVTELTKQEIQDLTFSQIQARLTPEQWNRIDTWAKLPTNGFGSARGFFAMAESVPEEEEVFKDYLIECLL